MKPPFPKLAAYQTGNKPGFVSFPALNGGRTVWSHIGSDSRADSKPENSKLLKTQAEWRQQDVTERGKSLDERGKRHSYLELAMRRSGSPILENYRSTKRGKKRWFRQRNQAEVRLSLTSLCLRYGVRWVGGAASKHGRNGVQLKVFFCPALNLVAGKTKAPTGKPPPLADSWPSAPCRGPKAGGTGCSWGLSVCIRLRLLSCNFTF